MFLTTRRVHLVATKRRTKQCRPKVTAISRLFREIITNCSASAWELVSSARNDLNRCYQTLMQYYKNEIPVTKSQKMQDNNKQVLIWANKPSAAPG